MAQGKGIFLSRSVDYILDVCSNQKVNPNMEIECEKVGYVV